MERWGYVKISRKAYATDRFWTEPRRYSRWEAWEDLIQMAAWRRHSRIVSDEHVTLERGELLVSRRYLAERWQWTEKEGRGFVRLLAETERIRAQRKAKGGTVYLIMNYGTYQSGRAKKGQAKGQPRANLGPTQGPKKKAVKQGKKGKQYTPEFTQAWEAYPDREGTNSKADAYRQWCARLDDGIEAAALLAGTQRYAEFARRDGIVGTRFVMQASRFYGRGRHFEQPWAKGTGGRRPAPQQYDYEPGVQGPAL